MSARQFAAEIIGLFLLIVTLLSFAACTMAVVGE